MSIEKIENLIKQAPEVSVWWKANTKSLKRWCIAREVFCFTAMGVGVVAIFGTIASLVALAANQIDGREFLLVLFPALLILFRGMLNIPSKLWPKKFTYGEMILDNNCTVPLEEKHKVLNAVLEIADPRIKHILLNLQSIKDLELPDCWWESLHTAAQKIIVQQTPPVAVAVERNIQDKYDEVYEKMDQVINGESSKVLRL